MYYLLPNIVSVPFYLLSINANQYSLKSVSKEIHNGKEAVYVPIETRRELYKSVSAANLKFKGKLGESESTNTYWYQPPPIEGPNSATLSAEMNLLNSQQQRLLLEKYNTIDYCDERDRYQKAVDSMPNDQYFKHTEKNKQLKAYEHQSHAFKTPQPKRRPIKKFRKLPKNKMVLSDIAQLPIDD